MPAGAPEATLNYLLTQLGTQGRWISLHSGDPGTTGANELSTSGGNPTYARKQTTWGTPAAGVMAGTAQTFDIAAGRSVSYFGVWSAASGGSWITGGPLRNAGNTASITESWTEQGTYALTPRLTADNIAL